MSVTLTKKEIKKILKRERSNGNPFQDEFDAVVNEVVSMHEKKVIDDLTLNLFLTIFIKQEVRKNFRNLNADLLRFSSLKRNSTENKLLLFNYSKKTYA